MFALLQRQHLFIIVYVLCLFIFLHSMVTKTDYLNIKIQVPKISDVRKMVVVSNMESKLLPTKYLQKNISSAEIDRATNKTQKVKKILFYTPIFNLEDWGFGFGQEPFERCPVSNCFTTNNHALNSISGFPMILDFSTFSSLRRYGQFWQNLSKNS